MDLSRWLAMPSQVESQVARWEREFPHTLTVDSITQHTGHRVFALTVGRSEERHHKPAAWFCVPHAHEPAGTAACMDVIHQLLTGHDLAGQPATFDYAAARDRLRLTFNPDANPGGRTWSPCVWWDGSRYTNDEFWTWMRGLDPDTAGMWKRVARWSLRQEHPLRRGIVYEQLNDHEFVEPNRDPGSSLVRLFRRHHARYSYMRSMHLHQTEFVNSPHNCMINLPVLQPELPPPIQEANLAWGRAVITRWRQLHHADAIRGVQVNPVPEPRAFPYSRDTQTTQWFRDCWGDYQLTAPELVIEIQNNNPRTPPAAQLALESAAIQLTIEQLLEQS
jgi:hypothetical protein